MFVQCWNRHTFPHLRGEDLKSHIVPVSYFCIRKISVVASVVNHNHMFDRLTTNSLKIGQKMEGRKTSSCMITTLCSFLAMTPTNPNTLRVLTDFRKSLSGFHLLTQPFDKVKVSQALDQSFVSLTPGSNWWHVALSVQLILKWSGTTSRHQFTRLALNKQPPLSWLYKTTRWDSCEGQTTQLTAPEVQWTKCYCVLFGSEYNWKNTVKFWLE